jgi:hypothetical protein
MNLGDWLIVGVCALVGFGIVWGAFGFVRQQKAPPVQIGEPTVNRPPAVNEPAATANQPGAGGLSLMELGQRWHAILQTSPDASRSEVERAYQARLAECDNVRSSPTATPDDKRAAESRRAQIAQAFDFIRQLK